MAGRTKKQILDALFDEPTPKNVAKRPDKALLQARQRFFESGIKAPADELTPRRIWQTHISRRGTTPGQSGIVWRRFAVPAVAAASVALAIGLLPWVKKTIATAGSRTAIQANVRHDFAETYERSVNLYVRRTENFTAGHKNQQLEISADSLTARIDFKATRAIKTVRIQTPQVVFEIIGTKIVLDVNPDKARLHVSEGRVKVSYAGKVEFVDAGEIWEYSRGVVLLLDEDESDEQLFDQLRVEQQAKISELRPEATAKPKAATKAQRDGRVQPAAKILRILLKDGTEISGRLIRENNETVVISAPLAGNREIQLRRENIESMRNEGGNN